MWSMSASSILPSFACHPQRGHSRAICISRSALRWVSGFLSGTASRMDLILLRSDSIMFRHDWQNASWYFVLRKLPRQALHTCPCGYRRTNSEEGPVGLSGSYQSPVGSCWYPKASHIFRSSSSLGAPASSLPRIVRCKFFIFIRMSSRPCVNGPVFRDKSLEERSRENHRKEPEQLGRKAAEPN